jgi:3'-phosphoadenosine 5'-phosphosulfate sulfotransferase (PAPS reductase)/FAD synthetase
MRYSSTDAVTRAHVDSRLVRRLVSEGYLFVVNHSGGKDSQAMYLILARLVPASQLLVIHAPLEDVEWDGCVEHIESTIDPEHEFILAHAVRRDGTPKSLLEEVERKFRERPDRVPWPDPQHRWCTSDFKTGPCTRETRRYADEHGFTKIVNCLGLRAEESAARSKRPVWRDHGKHGTKSAKLGAARDWYEWLPIHKLSTGDVFSVIFGSGQEPHFAYAEGMRRLSCRFCIMACDSDLTVSARLNPELYARYVEMERRMGYTMSMNGQTLVERTGIDPDRGEPVRLPVIQTRGEQPELF